MAAAALTPRVRLMVVCDGVKPSRVGRVYFHTLVGTSFRSGFFNRKLQTC